MTADKFDLRIARIEELLSSSTAEEVLREAEEWLAQGEARIARLAIIRAKSFQARTRLKAESAEEEGADDA